VGNVAFSTDWTLESHANEQFVFNDFSLYNDRIFVNLYAPLWPWSSNNYTLDHVVVDCYFHALPSTTPIPLDFIFTFVPGTPSHKATLRLLNQFFATTVQYFPLPAVDQPYWLPE
jgi:hypothetical protein